MDFEFFIMWQYLMHGSVKFSLLLYTHTRIHITTCILLLSSSTSSVNRTSSSSITFSMFFPSGSLIVVISVVPFIFCFQHYVSLHLFNINLRLTPWSHFFPPPVLVTSVNNTMAYSLESHLHCLIKALTMSKLLKGKSLNLPKRRRAWSHLNPFHEIEVLCDGKKWHLEVLLKNSACYWSIAKKIMMDDN